jgi:ABC-type sugar transport system ATPase subunit
MDPRSAEDLFRDRKRDRDPFARMLLDARIARLGQKLGTLSGGNQQKIILGRSLVASASLMSWAADPL